MINLAFWFGELLGRWVTFKGPLVKVIFSNFLHISQDYTSTFDILLSFPLFHRIDPTNMRHRTIIASLEVS
jgi:hypothetical protein